MPQRVGKASAQLMLQKDPGVYVGESIAPPASGRKQKILTVRPLVKPRVDVDAYAATVMQIVDQLAAEDPDRLREMTRR